MRRVLFIALLILLALVAIAAAPTVLRGVPALRPLLAWVHPWGGPSVAEQEHGHDVEIREATAKRDTLKQKAVVIERDTVRPALHRDSVARRRLRQVLADVDTSETFVSDSPRVALSVVETAAAQLDSTSERAIAALERAVVAEQRRAEASDTVATKAVTALGDERRSRGRERWVYRAKIVGGVLVGLGLGVVLAHVAP